MDNINGQEMTKLFEGGFRPRSYKDSRGFNTIGYGFNIDEPAIRQFVPADVLSGRRDLTKPEADTIFNTLYQNAIRDAFNFSGEAAFQAMTPAETNAIIDMAYNLGPSRLSQFVNMRQELQKGNKRGVAREMKNSNWYKQVGNRSKHHVAVFGGE